MFMNPSILSKMMAEREADLRRRSTQAVQVGRSRAKGSPRNNLAQFFDMKARHGPPTFSKLLRGDT